MTELMKRYESDFEKGLIHECYQSWLETEISDNKRYIATLESKIVMYEYEIKQLKAQLTWRPVREKPEECQRVFMKRGDHYCHAVFSDGYFINPVDATAINTKGVEWLPIPPAPEGE